MRQDFNGLQDRGVFRCFFLKIISHLAGRSLHMKSSRVVIHLLAWLTLAVSAFLIMLSTLPTLEALMRTAEVVIMVAIIHYVNVLVFSFTIRRSMLWQYAVLSFLMCGLIAFVRFKIDFRPLPIQSTLFPSVSPVVHWVFFLLSTGSVYLLSSVLLFLVRVGENERKMLRLIHAGNEAKLQYLDAQIKPHFLFNALNNVYSLVLTKSDKAPEMLLSLTSMLRYSIYQKPFEKIPVAEEAAQISRLIRVFGLKSDDPYKIKFTMNVSGGMIEPMILVPLAENCLKHCDFDLNPDAYVNIMLETDAAGLRFTSENTFRRQAKQGDGGVGLKNIRERLGLLYGVRCSLATEETGNVFNVKLDIAWEK